MFRFYSTFAAFLFVFLALALSAQQVNVSGDWEMTITTPRGDMTRNIHFDQEGEKIKVTMEGMRGGETSGEGTVKGKEIEWTITRSGPMGEMTVTYKGTVEGDTMKGEVQMGDRTVEWTAKRK